jgi:ATP-binding cassette, subfamily B (MDR/TAP), member 1
LLDEATSALDPTAEKIVQRALNNVARGRTMIVVAHRLSTIRDADNIVVVAKGVGVEQGTHAQLVERGGVYARLVEAQDLGQKNHAESSEKEDIDEQAEGGDVLDMVPTGAQDTLGELGEGVLEENGHGLFEGIWMVLKEQRPLWPALAVLAVVCVMGGKSTGPYASRRLAI